jgi:glycosyltransferase involved in cell wall biosynthesis
LRAKLGIPESALVIGFAGRLTRAKGIPELIEAFQRIRGNVYLLLVGDFEDGDPVSAEVRDYIEKDPRVILAGYVADVAPYYRLMDVFALPTHREGFGSASLEAQASGLPVVTTDATGVIDSVVEGVTGVIVAVGDADALAAELDKLLKDPARRRRSGKEAHPGTIRSGDYLACHEIAVCGNAGRAPSTAAGREAG